MSYRRFGQTELRLSVFSLGTMRGLDHPNTFAATLERALDLGINHIETARGYGPSERWLGDWLHRRGQPQDLILTTKIPPQPSREAMAQALADSLERLRVKRVDCLAIHGLNTPDHLAWVQDPKGCMAAVAEAQAEGKIGHVGFSTHGPREVIQAAMETGLFSFVLLHYYYFFQRHAPLMDLAQA